MTTRVWSFLAGLLVSASVAAARSSRRRRRRRLWWSALRCSWCAARCCALNRSTLEQRHRVRNRPEWRTGAGRDDHGDRTGYAQGHEHRQRDGAPARHALGHVPAAFRARAVHHARARRHDARRRGAGYRRGALARSAPPPPPPPSATARRGSRSPRESAPPGDPRYLAIVDFLDKNLIGGREPLKQDELGCTASARTTLLQLREPAKEEARTDADEVLYVVAGEGTLRLGNRDLPLASSTIAIVPRGTVRGLTRKGKNPLIVLSVVSGQACTK